MVRVKAKQNSIQYRALDHALDLVIAPTCKTFRAFLALIGIRIDDVMSLEALDALFRACGGAQLLETRRA